MEDSTTCIKTSMKSMNITIRVENQLKLFIEHEHGKTDNCLKSSNVELDFIQNAGTFLLGSFKKLTHVVRWQTIVKLHRHEEGKTFVA